MTLEERNKFIKEVFTSYILPVLNAKGHDYSNKKDANSNFKEVASLLKNLDKYDVWMVYFEKHLTALITWINDKKVKSETIENRIVDLINYLFILWTMASEDGLMKNVLLPDEIHHTCIPPINDLASVMKELKE